MSRQSRVLEETLRSLINTSDALEYVRSKYKEKNLAPHLLRGQENLVTAIDSLKKVDQIIKEVRRKERQDEMVDEQRVEDINNRKKKDVEKLNQTYRVQFQVIKEQGLMKQSEELLEKDYLAELKELNAKYDDEMHDNET